MKKLLIVTTVPETLSSFFLTFANYFRVKGWQVDAMAREVTSSPECVKEFNQVWDINWSRNPLNPRNLLVAPSQIRSIIVQEKYDLIQVSTPVAAFVTRYALRNLDIQDRPRIIYSALGLHFYQGGSLLKNSVFLALERLAGTWTDYLVVINHEDKEAAERYELVPPHRVLHIPGIGLSLDRFNPEEVSHAEILQVKQTLGLSSENPLLLCVAEFISRKRHRDILLAFAQLNSSDAHLAFAGTGPLLEQMRQLATVLNIQNQVHFLGERRDIPVLMRASVATILASEQEGLPQCVMESMGMEIPVIGTDIRGTRDLLECGCGLLVKLGDIQGLAQAMKWILAHPEDACLMGERGSQNLVNYELQNILEKYEKLYGTAVDDYENKYP